jgi:hypothetical protein
VFDVQSEEKEENIEVQYLKLEKEKYWWLANL